MHENTFVIGGCRSGKSRHALEVAESISRENRLFIATCEPRDQEMRDRVADHQKERGQSWKTVEAHLRLPEAVEEQGADAAVILVDCLTLWVSNILMESEQSGQSRHSEVVLARVKDLTRSIKNAACPVIVVSNEVGTGIVPENSLARLYRDLVGMANQAVAEAVPKVVWTIAGIPVTIKGEKI